MKLFKTWSFLSLCCCMSLCWFSCTTDVCISSYKYSIETTDNLSDPYVNPGQTIRLNVFFPNRIFTDTVNFDNISQFPFKAALYIRSLTDTTKSIEDQDNAWDNFTSTVITGEETNSVGPSIDLSQSKAIRAQYFNDTMRAIQVELQTSIQDTYLLYWTQANTDNDRISRGSITMDTCTNVVNFILKNTSENYDTLLTSNLKTDFQSNRSLKASTTFIVQ
jgi:hypothetical protein